MMVSAKKAVFALWVVAILTNLSCASQPLKPCSLGGQPARSDGSQFRGIKRCYQTVNASGQLVNEGKYYEWYNNDKPALVGQYQNGKKVGRWIEYDESGKIISDKQFENGVEIPPP